MEESKMVLEPAREILKKIYQSAARLNEASDQFSQELRTIEQELNEARPGLDFTYRGRYLMVSDAWSEEDDRGEMAGTFRTVHYLAYGKHRDAWKLLVREYIEKVADDEAEDVLTDTVPLLDASRDLRIEAAELILEFLTSLWEKSEKKIASVEKVKDARKS